MKDEPIKPRMQRGTEYLTELFSSCRCTSFGLIFLSALLVVLSPGVSSAIGGKSYVSFNDGKDEFALSCGGKSAPLFASSKDYPGVLLILRDFEGDIGNVTGVKPEVYVDTIPESKDLVIIGTIGKNDVIDKLIREKRIDVTGIAGEWESFVIQQVNNPLPGIDRALVIAGSDKRGTMYGMFDISERIGVSPWYWWADVPVKRHENVFILPGRHSDGPPSVKYRGIFLNDEWPDLTNWVMSKYGMVPASTNPPIPPGVANYNHLFYERIFELILRLKGNYLWPAMWNNAFNEDDPENPRLADEYGIVMGTSHQEPMLRAQKEWDRRYLNTLGSWNYAKYPDTLQEFWREGIYRNRNYENIITIGLRGANDTPMAPGGPEANMALLEKIIDVQRKIIAREMNPDGTKVPQMWCLYKEVLDYYNAGMRVPDDVTILWPDDNWGNIRRLPTRDERRRSGGAGIYYHFDYHGGPRNYQWINSTTISKIWDQMSLAKEYGADRIWIVNVGHLKGYELPIQFFMDFGWNTKRWTNANLDEYTKLWSEEQFGSPHAEEIAGILSAYTKYNARRKPELLSPATYSLVNYREADRVVEEFKNITKKAQSIYGELPQDERDAFYELVLYPTEVSAILDEMYHDAGLNELYSKQGRAGTDSMAAMTRLLFSADTSLFGYFNRSFAGGKWDHFMDQPVVGYTGWNQPPQNNLDAVKLSEPKVPDSASMAVAVEGSEDAWPGPKEDPALPGFDPFNEEKHYIDIFNKGRDPFGYKVSASNPWIIFSTDSGVVSVQTRLNIGIDWRIAPSGKSLGIVTISGTGEEVKVRVNLFNPKNVNRMNLTGFMEENRCVSIEAAHYSEKIDAGESKWNEVEDYGNSLSGMRASSVADAPAAVPEKNSPCLEYRMFLTDTGKVVVDAIFGPSLNFMPGRGVRYAVSFDDNDPVAVTLVPEDYNVQNSNSDWSRSVIDNSRRGSSTFFIRKEGYHTLKVWMIDPGIVLEKIVVDLGGVKPSYLGPPESYHGNVKNDN